MSILNMRLYQVIIDPFDSQNDFLSTSKFNFVKPSWWTHGALGWAGWRGRLRGQLCLRQAGGADQEENECWDHKVGW